MKKYLIFTIAIFTVILAVGVVVVTRSPVVNHQQFAVQAADSSQVPYNELATGKVDKVLEKDEAQGSRYSRISETLQVTLTSGSEKGQQVEVDLDEQLTNARLQEVKAGDTIVVGKVQLPSETDYVMVDRYRLPALAWLAAGFLFLAVLFGRWRGLTSLAGLLASLAILVGFVVPNLLAEKNPTLVTLVGAGCIALVSMFLAHGFNSRTMVAVISTLITLSLAEAAAYFAVIAIKLIGNGSEEAFYLQQGFLGNINLGGLLLGGIIIGTLGILNDITTAQSAAVEEIYDADKSLSFNQLYKKGGSVGREHIASLINTLVLTYAGASLPLFLLIMLTSNGQFWAILNSEALAEEITRTLVGSMALIIAVPITTALAGYYFSRNVNKPRLPEEPKDDYWDKAKEIVSKL